MGACSNTKVIKKNGELESFQQEKIVNACKKAAARALDVISDQEYNQVCENVIKSIIQEYGSFDDVVQIGRAHV